MSLVAYDSGSESDGEDSNPLPAEAAARAPPPGENKPKTVQVLQNGVPANKQAMGKDKNSYFRSALMEDEDEEDLPVIAEAPTTAGASYQQQQKQLKFDAVLPKPKYTNSLGVEEDPLPPKKTYGDEELMPKPPAKVPFASLQKEGIGLSGGGKVRITVPSLKDFENDEEDDESSRKRVIQASKKGSGLFAILPEPKGTFNFKAKQEKTYRQQQEPIITSVSSSASSVPAPVPGSSSLIPQQVAQKRPLSPTSVNQRLAQVRAKYMKQEIDIKVVSNKAKTASEDKGPSSSKTTAKAAAAAKLQHDSDSEEEGNSDFFSFNSANDEPTNAMEVDRIPSPVFFSDRMETENNPEEEDGRLPSASASFSAAEAGNSTFQSEDDLMKYIQPNKRRRGGATATPVNIIDVSADQLRPDSTEWLKAISDTSMIPPRKVNLPGGVGKRKHQITYLAAEAKAREEELQNMWAANRHTKRMTQSKYGF